MALASPFFGKREHAPAPYSPNSGRNLNGTVRTEAVNNLTQQICAAMRRRPQRQPRLVQLQAQKAAAA